MDKPKWADNQCEYDRYHDYLNSATWAALRNKRMILDNFQCAICGETKQLQVHHIFYPFEYGTESMNDLMTLCPTCHGIIETLKKKGTTTSRMSKRYIRLSWYVNVSIEEYQKFHREVQIPDGSLEAIFYFSNIDKVIRERTNLLGIKKIIDYFKDEVSTNIDVY